MVTALFWASGRLSTHDDLYTNFLNYRPELGSKLMELRAAGLSLDENLATNLMYGAAVCRLCYYSKPDALPEAGDIEGQASFWKEHYNIIFGAGTVSKYVYKVQQVFKAD